MKFKGSEDVEGWREREIDRFFLYLDLFTFDLDLSVLKVEATVAKT